MNKFCEVLRIYNTSIGDIFELGFQEDVVLVPGMYLRTFHNYSIKITGVAMNNSEILLKQHNKPELQVIWDVQIELSEGVQISVGDKIFLFDLKE